MKDRDKTQFLAVSFFRRKTHIFYPCIYLSSCAYYCGHAKLGFSELALLVALFSNNNHDVIVSKATVCFNMA